MGYQCQDCGKVLATMGGLDVHRATWCGPIPQPAPQAAELSPREQRRKARAERRLARAIPPEVEAGPEIRETAPLLPAEAPSGAALEPEATTRPRAHPAAAPSPSLRAAPEEASSFSSPPPQGPPAPPPPVTPDPPPSVPFTPPAALPFQLGFEPSGNPRRPESDERAEQSQPSARPEPPPTPPSSDAPFLPRVTTVAPEPWRLVGRASGKRSAPDRRRLEAELREREREEKWSRWEELHRARLKLAEERLGAQRTDGVSGGDPGGAGEGSDRASDLADRGAPVQAPESPSTGNGHVADHVPFVLGATPTLPLAEPAAAEAAAEVSLDEERRRVELERQRLDEDRRRLEAERQRLEGERAEVARAAAEAARAAAEATRAAADAGRVTAEVKRASGTATPSPTEEAAGAGEPAVPPAHGRTIYEGLNDVLDLAVKKQVLRRNPLRRSPGAEGRSEGAPRP